MKLDNRMVTGILIGILAGLHYHGLLIEYMPVLTLVTAILVLKIVLR